jgi:hypothetical protein
MDKTLFQKGQEIQERIQRLAFLKKYLEGFLKNEPVTVKIDITVLGTGLHDNKNLIAASGLNRDFNEEDGKSILEFIDQRIASLEKQFEEL